MIAALLLLLASVQEVPWLDRLAEARARWAEARPVSYEYTITLSGFDWHSPLRCSVDPSGARVEEIPQPHRDQREWPPARARTFVRYCTVENLFLMTDRHIRLRLADPPGKDFRSPVVVTYDDRLGFPTNVVIDPSKIAIDDELEFHVRDFVIKR